VTKDTCYENGASIEGERIACQFRKYVPKPTNRGSSAHRAGRATLENAYCVITKPLRSSVV